MKIDWIDSDHLAAGSIPFDAKDIRALHQQGIRAIVSLTTHPLTALGDITPDLLRQLDITYFHTPIRDHYPPSIAQAQKIMHFFEQMKAKERPTFIHCHAGVGRTGTILHAYFLAQGFSLAEAKAQVKSGRIQCILLSNAQKSFLREFAAAIQKSER